MLVKQPWRILVNKPHESTSIDDNNHNEIKHKKTCSYIVLYHQFHLDLTFNAYYLQTSNISSTLVGNKIVDHSDVGAAPTTSSFSI